MIKEHEVTGVCLFNYNKHQVTTPSRKEDDTDSTATMTTTTFNTAEKEDDTDSTASKTTTAFKSTTVAAE